jgi:hypothetical protein
LGVKRPGREVYHSPPSSAEVKNAWSYTFTPPIRLHGVVLIYSRAARYTLSTDSTHKLRSEDNLNCTPYGTRRKAKHSRKTDIHCNFHISPAGLCVQTFKFANLSFIFPCYFPFSILCSLYGSVLILASFTSSARVLLCHEIR